MEDVEFTFLQDVIDKKRIAASSHKKRIGGSKTALTPKQMTKKETDKMNGEVISFDKDTKLTYTQFKELTAENQSRYLQMISKTYCVFLKDIAERIFGVHEYTLKVYMYKNGVKLGIANNRRKPTEEQHAAWNNFLEESDIKEEQKKPVEIGFNDKVYDGSVSDILCSSEDCYEKARTIIDPEWKESFDAIVKDNAKACFQVPDSMTLAFTDRSIETIAKALEAVLGKRPKGRITIIFDGERNET